MRFDWLCVAYRASVISPRGPHHFAGLNVEGEVLDGDLAGGAVDPVGEPNNFPREVHDHVCIDDRIVVVGVSAGIGIIKGGL